MGIIRGKIETDREVVQKKITIGDSSFYECECCGKWFDKKTNKECRVTTMGELLKEMKAVSCERHEGQGDHE